MSAKAEARDIAYRTWCECGQNLSETERRLNQNGLPVTRQTLAEWREKYDWPGRAARTEASCKERKEATSDEAILSSLLMQKERYEEYFTSLQKGQVDNQALYAYSALLKTLVELRQGTSAFKTDVFGKFFRELLNFLHENDPDAAEVVSRNFDDFIAHVRQKFMAA